MSLELIIDSETTHDQVLALLEYLMLNTPDSKNNPFNGLIDFLSDSVEAYEKEIYLIPETSS